MTESHNYSNPRIVISGLRGGSGKTILSLCLVASLRKKEIKVIPFKKGPDYIDAGWLAKAAGTPCYNLDLFMMTPEQALQSFVAHTYHFVNAECGLRLPAGAGNAESNSELRTPNSELLRQIALIEGNRGLYDGFDHKGTYSTAELAKLLKAPVIIVIDCTKATNTIAAMVLGCQKMDPDVPISGIVLNQIATNRQEALIRRAIHERCALPVVGAIPRLKKDPFPERHMGLTPFQEYTDIERSLAAVLEIGEKYVDVDGILKIAREATTLKIAECGLQNAELTNSEPRNAECGMRLPAGAGNAELKNSEIRNPKSAIKIGIIRDSAFQFYYQENFEALEKRGAQLIEINALKATDLPEIDALYIGGGFPETNALALAENTAFRNSLRDAIEKGLPVYAECGGLMYLGESLILDGKTYPMAGVLPVVFGLDKKPQAHGYSIVEVEIQNPFFHPGTVLKGHEFHYSKVLEINTPLTPLGIESCRLDRGEEVSKHRDAGGFSEQIFMAFNVKRGKGIINNKDGMCYKNVLATYTHLHAAGAPEWADGLVRCAREFKDRKK